MDKEKKVQPAYFGDIYAAITSEQELSGVNRAQVSWMLCELEIEHRIERYKVDDRAAYRAASIRSGAPY